MIHKVWVLQCLVLTLKCLSTLSKTLVPISLAEHHHLGNHSGHRDTLNNINMDMDALEETYAASYENALFGVLILSILYNWFFTKPPSLYLGLIAVLLQGSSCITLVALALNTASLTGFNMDTRKVFSLLHFIQLFSMFLISQHVTYYSIHNSVPSSKLKLIPTIAVAAIQVLFVYYSQYLAFGWVLMGFAIVLFVGLILLYNLIHTTDNSSNPTATENSLSDRVPLLSTLLFLMISVVGLNGEQLLDSIMTVKIRDDYFSGNKGSSIAKQLITLISALLALLTTSQFWKPKSPLISKPSSPTSLIAIWALAQFVRVFFFSDTYSTNNFGYIIGLILLDKYTGSLGEIALEQSMLNFLHANAILASKQKGQRISGFGFPMLWLMAVYGFVEDFTQGLARSLVRSARKAPANQLVLYAFWQNRSMVVCSLVCVPILFVFYTKHKKIKQM